MPRGGKHVGASARYEGTGVRIETWEKGVPQTMCPISMGTVQMNAD
jgi:hypothetical protein